jgi:hypothetical protein
MLVKESDEDKRRELTTVLKAYREDEKTKVEVHDLIDLNQR